MRANANPRSFTGRHMAIILVVGFGIVAAVNFTMASFATSGFHGVVVENTYVASQKFNGWLEEAEKSQTLGWGATATRDDTGFVWIDTKHVPDDATISAELRRPLGDREYANLTFAQMPDGTYRSNETMSAGRWTIRLSIITGAHDWIEESELK